MKFLLDKIKSNQSIIAIRSIFFILFVGLTITAFGQLPAKPEPFFPVTDFANVLTEQQENRLAQQFAVFNQKTSTAIVIVTVNDLQGIDKAQYAVDLAHKWELGQKGKDNGILILVKPKTATSGGEAYIAVGYGLEGVVPDAVALQIVNYEMIPDFKTGDYYGGLSKASKVLMDITANEYTAEQYAKSKGGDLAGLIPFFFFIIIFIIFTMKGRNRASGVGSRGGSSLLAGMLLGSMMGGGRSSSGWGNFNSGGGSFGGGGGFGGFSGGGGFGGGGAGGSW